MDLNGYWQENKRFLVAVGCGLVLFLIGWMAIASFFGDELAAKQRRERSLRSDLEDPMYSSSDLAQVRAENEALALVFDELRERVEFEPREAFALRDGDAPSSRYFGVVSDVRDDLIVRCGRAGLAFPDDLGLPRLAPTREQEIRRYLEALDVVEATLSLGIETGCERVERIQIGLDPRLLSGRPIEDLEKTLVELRLTGPASPMVALLGLLQQERDGRVLLVERAEVQAGRSARDEVRMDLVLVVPHLHGLAADEGGEPEGEG